MATKAPPDVCRLTLRIRDRDYDVRPVGTGFRLRRLDGKADHHVVVGPDGVACDCEDSTFRPGVVCKHRKALAALGLIGRRGAGEGPHHWDSQ